MTSKWKKAYHELEEHIATNPDIQIKKNITIIPGEARENFYRVFDNVEAAFIKEQTSTIFEEACKLSNSYLAEAGVLKNTLKVTEIKTTPRLNWLLNDPLNGISRALFDPLFDSLKTSKGSEEFEFKAEEIVKSYWQSLYKKGYESWVILSLSNMLSPESVLAPSWDEIVRQCHELQPDQKRGWTAQDLPKPEEIRNIELGHEGYDPAFIIANIILHSKKLNKYVSFGADLTDAAWSARNASEKREWITLRKRGLDLKPLLNWPGFVMNTDIEPAEISLVSDFSRFLRPELMVECMVQEDWYQRGELDKIKVRHDFFKPTLGTFIVSRYPVTDEAFKALEPDAPDKITLETQATAGIKTVPVLTVDLEASTGAESWDNTIAGTKTTPEMDAEKNTRRIFIISTAGYDRNMLNPIIEALTLPVKEDDRPNVN